MGYVVAVPLAIVRMGNGSMVHLYEGQPVPSDADPEHVKTLVAAEALAPGNGSAGEPEASAPEIVKPAGNASFDAWATYAVDSGQATEEDVKGMTRDELRELYG